MTPTDYCAAVAAEVRAEMARQRRTQGELAAALRITAPTAARRLDGSVPFDVRELMTVAVWLGVPVTQLLGHSPEAVSA